MSSAGKRSMRRLFLASAARAMAVSMLVVGVPIAVWFWWVTGRRHDVIDAWISRSGALRALDLGIVLTLLLVVGAVVSYAVTRSVISRVVAPLEELATNAELLASGDDAVRATDSGIAEVDQISQALMRASREVSLSLTAERTFASDASHQLRTPLTALLMRLEEIASTDDLDVVRDEASIAIAQVERLGGVVKELLQRRRDSPEQSQPDVSLDSILASM